LTEVFAHRGSARLVRENTVAAFAAARALGADGIELDVRRTADGALVVHHDAELPGQGRIAELSSSELPSWLPSLVEALDACRPLAVNIEIKAAGGAVAGTGTSDDQRLASEVASLARSREEADRLVISSFSLRAIDAVRAGGPGLQTALLVDPAEDAMSALATAHGHGHEGLHPFFFAVDATLVNAARMAGMAIRPWTVDDPASIAELGELGVAAVITNDVATALRALGRS
jgi:glycerophosphoryl diester phosphodiesterase